MTARSTALLVAMLLGSTALVGGTTVGFQNDCAGATLDGSVTLPVSSPAAVGSSADFTMPSGCVLGATAVSDVITCFTPTNNCSVTFTCTVSGGSHVRASVVDLSSSSACAGDLSSDTCAASDEQTPATPAAANATLLAGQAYCFVCQNTIGNQTFNAQVTTLLGDCGALPVALESLDVR